MKKHQIIHAGIIASVIAATATTVSCSSKSSNSGGSPAPASSNSAATPSSTPAPVTTPAPSSTPSPSPTPSPTPSPAPAATGLSSDGFTCTNSPKNYYINGACVPAVPLYRFYNATNHDHFYTLDAAGEGSTNIGYVGEGITCYVYDDPNATLTNFNHIYRLVRNGDHFYAATLAEANNAVANLNYKIEDAYAIFPTQVTGTVNMYRFYNAAWGVHFMTLDQGGEGSSGAGFSLDGPFQGFVFSYP